MSAAFAALSVASLAVALIAIFGVPASTLHVFGVRLRAASAGRPLLAAFVFSGAAYVSCSRTWARRSAGALVGISTILALLATARSAEPTPPVGDVGLIEAYIFQALDGRLFLGPYSRFLWHHPGPTYFYLLAPMYVLSGYRTAGVAAAALVINLAAITIAVLVSRRFGNRGTAAVLASACAMYAWRFSPLLRSQWNPHVVVFPLLASVVVAAAVASGGVMLVPLLLALDSFAVQTHLGLAPTLAAVTACAVGTAYARTRDAHRFWVWTNAGLWTAALLWFLPIVEQLTHSPGNVTRLWHFFVAGGGGGQSIGPTFSTWAGAMTGSIRSAFHLAWGGETPRGLALGTKVAALFVPPVVLSAAWLALRKGRVFEAALCVLSCVAAVAAFWSVSRIAGEIVDHEVFWISGVGLLACAAAAAVGLNSIPLMRRLWSGFGPDVVCVAMIAAVVAVGVIDFKQEIAALRNPGDEEVAAATLSDEIVSYSRKSGIRKLLVDVDGEAWGVAAGVVVELRRAGVPYAVTPNAVWMFGGGVAPDGTETRRILISRGGGHAAVAGKPGVTTLAARRGYFADLIAAEPQ